MVSYLIIFILLIISVASFSAAEKAKKKRKGLKFTFSVTLALMLPFLVEGTVLYALSIVLYTTLQLILYDIGLMGK
ncbi:hypothetical protein [Evansella halocellulosilytica]|uniref:hypothetical protein n=1 Tax=Evansella halocellulosilytica TaxID=2011013 RepID=UPI000BB68029|nr:hypothetical protein [Evansella halocellulosilytica]